MIGAFIRPCPTISRRRALSFQRGEATGERRAGPQPIAAGLAGGRPPPFPLCPPHEAESLLIHIDHDRAAGAGRRHVRRQRRGRSSPGRWLTHRRSPFRQGEHRRPRCSLTAPGRSMSGAAASRRRRPRRTLWPPAGAGRRDRASERARLDPVAALFIWRRAGSYSRPEPSVRAAAAAAGSHAASVHCGTAAPPPGAGLYSLAFFPPPEP
jgi:hypothetical protein